MSRNEKTSAGVAKIAAKVLAADIDMPPEATIEASYAAETFYTAFKWSDIRALAASALTQTADKERRYNPDVPQPWVEQPTDEQKAAVEWLQGMMRVGSPAPPPNAVATLLAMLPKHAGKPLKVDRQPAPKRRPYDDRGFDPRDGGKIGKQRVPKRKARKPASSPFYPSARPPRNSP